eukprot:TRINITY_DN33929_c0_g1_i1.p1 TRINITY_DN33929_c0_g1~~TRINITY_DN33929_c0_g1_i1.p1  ORF type:complete len:400 (+),score=79.58 TRINITY_DN33929_c0_g1_i1:301-1500(+)
MRLGALQRLFAAALLQLALLSTQPAGALHDAEASVRSHVGQRSLVRSEAARLQADRQLIAKEAQEEEEEGAAAIRSRFTRSGSGEVEGSVPALRKFREDFEQLQAKEANSSAGSGRGAQQSGGALKLLIGVLSRGFEQEYRDVHRQTWLSTPGACAVDIRQDVAPPPADKDCRFYVTFVTGHNEKTNRSLEAEAAEHRDVTPIWFADTNLTLGEASPVVLYRDGVYRPMDQLDAGDKGFDWIRAIKLKKSMWLRFASLHYRWATHIASADLDTYPHVDMILADLQDPARSQWADKSIQPAGWSEDHGGVYYGASCAGAMGFKQGAFTCISRGFLECMFENPQLRGHLDLYLGVPRGDVIVARLVTVASKTADSPAGTCPAPWWVGPAHCSWETRWAHPV